MEINGLDAKDNAIIELLCENARSSYSEIGEKVGLSRVAVKNRIKALEKQGIIKGYHAVIDPLAFPKMLPFIFEITTDAPSFQIISQMLAEDERVISLCEISLGCSLHAIVMAESIMDMKKFVRKYRDDNAGVLRCYAYNIYDMKKGSVLSYKEEHINEHNSDGTS